METIVVPEHQPDGLEAALSSPDYIQNWLAGFHETPPAALSELGASRVREMYDIAPDAEGIDELTLLRAAKPLVEALTSKKLQEGARLFLAGYHESLLRSHAPGYRRAVKALRASVVTLPEAVVSEERTLSVVAAQRVVSHAVPAPRIPADQSPMGKSVTGTNKPVTEKDIEAGRQTPNRDTSLAWQNEGACREVADPDIFFPVSKNDDVETAKAICRGCKVLGLCRAWALPQEDLRGIWAGLTEMERRAERQAAEVAA